MSQIFSLPGQRFAFKAAVACFAFCGVFTSAQQAHAVPLLQLYIEGATYTGSDESWTANTTVGTPIKVWAVSNDKASIADVRLVISWTEDFNPSGDNLLVTGSNAGLSDFGDTTTPNDPSGSAVFEGGKNGVNPPLSPHGIFKNDNVFWMEFLLGEMSAKDTKIADFNSGFSGEPHDNKKGQINAYEITLLRPVSLHFDLYGLIPSDTNPGKGKKPGGSTEPTFTVVNAPFSHDAVVTADPTNPAEPAPIPAPEPTSLALLALGCFGIGGYGWRKRNAGAL